MDVTATWLGAAAIAVLLGISAFFSSSEIAIFSLRPEWIEERAAGDGRARTLAALRSNPHRLLVTLLVGNNVVNIAISSLTTVLLLRVLPEGYVVAATTVVASTLVLVFGEIVPKSYGLGHAEEWSLTAARPIRLVELALYPLVAGFDRLTRGLSAAVGGRRSIERPYVEE